ncbi:MAG: RpiB/LacA/LacB family sugar-phosphate isomerase [Tannerella sp.]|jgi:ribose 5-phosphate isomerase B|nr:RpiB/LacA/LacB family sugar-phosphate isomerase [Tannerella sp.]
MNLTNTTIGLANDHTGFEYKELIKKHLEKRGLDYVDFGATSLERSDYPDYAHKLGKAIENKEIDMGIALCGTGNGMALTLNKYPSIRAGLAWNVDIARLISAHNKANILVMPARFVTQDEAIRMVDAYIDTPFEGGRHQERIDKIYG